MAERTLPLRVENVDPLAVLTVKERGRPETGSLLPGAGVVRDLVLPLAPGPDLELVGTLPCPRGPRLAAFGDIQTGVAEFEAVAAALTARRAADDALLGALVVGDLSDEATEEELALLRGLFLDAGVPFAVTTGNHDTYGPDRDVFARVFGPATYAFSVCGARVVFLDTGDAGLAPSVEARLPELLARGDDALLLAGMHYPPFSSRYGNGWTEEAQQARVLAELGAARADLALAGHVHNLVDFPRVPVGTHRLRQVVVGTGGADQGTLPPRFGFLEIALTSPPAVCFVPVVPDGTPPEPARPDEPPMCADAEGL